MTTLSDICNLTAEQIKNDRGALIEAAKSAGVIELASRCVQWLIDAKIRDEKLAEQGKTIVLLQSSLETATAGRLAASNQAQDLLKELAEVKGQFARCVESATQDIDVLQSKIDAAEARGTRLRKEALRNVDAINTAAGILNLAISASQIEQANGG